MLLQASPESSLLIIRFGSKSPSHRIFGHIDRHQILQQIIGTTRFAAETRHFVSAKRMAFDQGSRDLAIEVQVANFHLLSCSFQILRRAGVHSTREGKLCVVGEFERFVEVVGFDHT